MPSQIQKFIDDARHFQRTGNYELAIASLSLAHQKNQSKEHEIEIQKLLSFNYRKIKNFDMALLHINNALRLNEERSNSKDAQSEKAICLMNKGIICEESLRYDKALDCYLLAVNIIIALYKGTPDQYGLIINALFTLGTYYYNRNQFDSAYEVLKSSLIYFGDGKELDRRYLAICNTLQELQKRE